MSPLSLRRYRAERLLRSEFDALRGRVIGAARVRLRAAGVSLDGRDLDACYAHAWQGLYAATLDGREIANPSAWLALVTFRRAIEEHRAQMSAHGRHAPPPREGDLAADLDDRVRLRQLFEGLCARLSAREREAATLCYLQGLSRSEAAARLGVSELRMRRLMDGHGAGRPGVAGKVGELAAAIRAGDWCEQQGSLMRGFAYGVLDPDGPRHRLALLHSRECPACRAYVASLRGLAAVLPPAFAPGGLAAAALARLLDGGHAARAAGGAAGHGGSGVGGVGCSARLPGGSGAALPISGTIGVGGGGWLLGAGPLGAKLAVGCLLALGIGAGCLTLGDHPAGVRDGARRVAAARDGVRHLAAAAAPPGELTRPPVLAAAPAPGAGRPALGPAATVSREFGPEQSARGGGRSAGARGETAVARSASGRADASGGGEFAAARATSRSAETTASPADGDASAAAAATREFAPG